MILTRATLLPSLLSRLAPKVRSLEAKNVTIAQTNYKGRSAIQVLATPGAANGVSRAVIKGAVFRDGTIEVDLAANRRPTHSQRHGGLSASLFEFKAIPSSTSFSDRPTAGPTIKSGGITPRNTVHTRALALPNRAGGS